MENQFDIKIKYHTDAPHVKENAQGDMYDICAAETVSLKKGSFCLIDLGISIKMPEGCTCWIVPRSSTYKRYKIIQTNSVGVIDGSYSGNNDIIKFPARADEDTVIRKGDYICQMCVTKRPPRLTFTEVDSLDDVDRGGFGSTGR